MTDINQIIELSATRYGVTVEQIKSSTRKKPIIEARQVSMWLAKKRTKYSLSFIGSHFDGNEKPNKKDHSSVIHSIKTIDNAIEFYKHKKDFILSILDELLTYDN